MFESKPHLTSWLLNVQDKFKALSTEQIKDELKQTLNPFAVAFEHWQGDFNMSTGLRNANGFNAQECFYIGKKQFDRRGAVGTHHYTKLTNFKTFEEFYTSIKDEYSLIGIDNIPNKSVPIEDFQWPSVCKKKPLMLFGEEGCGLTEEAQEYCETILHITMYGSVRSFNCGTSSGIVMYDFINKCNQILPERYRWNNETSICSNQ